ncbi:hypothetical protein PM082_010514 [Marasmius tenuissimus]|nr:hypothetical protein PM082_010514 [Marasmius tenuissimus]
MIVHVVKNLDPTSIERFAAVNRKARLVSLDTSIWSRFYPNGQVLSLLTNEEQPPAEVIPRLKPTRGTKGLFIGTWHLSGTTIVLSNLIDSASLSDPTLAPVDLSSPSSVLAAINHAHLRTTQHQTNNAISGPSHNRSVPEHPLRYVFTMTLSLRSRPLGRWNKLDISSYDSVNLETGDAYPVALKHERPFWFSKVRSYAHS